MFFLLIIATTLAVFFSGFFSASEIAYFSLTEVKLKSLVKKNIKNSQYIAKLKSNPERLLTTILIYNNLVNIGTSSVVTYIMTNLFGSTGIGIATGSLTLIFLVFGDIVPKSIATRYSIQIALRSARILYYLQLSILPIVWFFEQISKAPRYILRNKQDGSQITDEDVVSMASISFNQGEILEYERDVITNILNLDDTQVKKVMTPKSQMQMVSSDLTLAEIVKTVNKQHYSRIPIYHYETNEMIGFIFLRDILYQPKTKWTILTAMDILRPPLVAHETDLLHDVYNMLIKNSTHLIIVKNKNEDLVGMVTLEDIIEEVLGEIYDETDPKSVY